MNDNDEMDREANYFAMCLLMPEPLLREAVQGMKGFDLSDDKQIGKLADKFKVSISIMAIRLGQIGLLKV
jgi:Zn-dependent peptidase ImmA (M78 family)